MTKNGLELYAKIGRRETLAQRWNDLTDEQRLNYTRLAQGCIALIKLHGVEERELVKYLMQYTTVKEEL